MTKYVVQYKDEAFIKFDRITQGIGIKSRIVTLVEPVYSYKSASEFSSEESARDIINTVEDYDTTEFNIRNVDILEQEAKERAEQEAKDFMKQTWRNTSEERQKEILKDMLDAKGPEAVKEFLDSVQDDGNNELTEGE